VGSRADVSDLEYSLSLVGNQTVFVMLSRLQLSHYTDNIIYENDQQDAIV
jgi:hypothetical protein